MQDRLRVWYVLGMLLLGLGVRGQQAEFRAVWISTVFNTDWPSKAGLSTERQKAELIQQLDVHARNGINAIIFQVRTSSDTFYPSEIDPWSQWLSGRQDQAPQPYYDPLAFIIEQAHQRGMELHAWLNPYRAEIDTGKHASVARHVARRHPEWCVAYDRRNYLDPGVPQVREYIVDVVREILRNYPVDGIHFDDYFYPYKIKGLDFKDDASYARYGKDFPSKADWRRDNVNRIVEMLHQEIQAQPRPIKFGISPFGIWRNKRDSPLGSESRGMTNYHDLYADVRLWLERGWIDYVMPQLYWPIGDSYADFATLTDWWAANAFGRHVYIGIGVYNAHEKATRQAWRDPQEIPRQVTKLRNTTGIQGLGFYSSSHFLNNPLGINDYLSRTAFVQPVKTPEMPWKQPLLAVAKPTVQPKDSVRLPDPPKPVLAAPTDFRIVRQGNELLFAWDHSSAAQLGAITYRIYRFDAKTGFDIESATLYAETSSKSILTKRKSRVLWRKRFAFVVVAHTAHTASEPSVSANARMSKREAVPSTNPQLIVY